MFDFGEPKQKFIKRIIGLEGDTVAPGPGNTILVNGRPWMPPKVCGTPPQEPDTSGSGIPFELITVPKGKLFVIGDNLNHSFDSRSEGFGLLAADKILGRPWLIYVSPGMSRIGCRVQ